MATDASRALIESIINGELTQASREETVRLRFARPYLPLTHTPVTAVASVVIGDDTIAAGDYRGTPNGLFRLDGSDWPTGDIVVTYSTGWVVASEPAEVLAALARADTLDLGVVGEKVGDLSVQRDAGATLASIRALVKRWVRP